MIDASFEPPRCLLTKYVEDNSLIAMLAVMRLAGSSIRDQSQGTCKTYMPPPSMNKAAHSDFETQWSTEVKNRGISGRTKRTNVLEFFF